MSSSNNLKIPLYEISLATNEFAEANIIGRGGYGVVYKGRQSERHGMLAIKRLNRVHGQGDHEYGMEVTLLSKHRHENLVSLIGFCGEDGEKILVYKYEANQSLDKFLHRKDLSWEHRLHICLGAARGLRYLHGETRSEHVVIHRDIKCSNILLDENWNAKISDFGLSKISLTNSANSVVFTNPCGTQGYADPQILFGGVTQKSDVYSFGVVLYEVLFGKLVAIPEYFGTSNFTIKMAKKHYEENTLDKMIYPDLRNEMKPDSLCTFSTIAYQCLKEGIEDRPTMSLVVEALEKALEYQQASTRESFESSSSGYLYDVYIFYEYNLNHNIFDLLCDALKREGLSIYMETKYYCFASRSELVLKSRSVIIFLTKNLVFNIMGLGEVSMIAKSVKERGNIVIPVYWDMDPSEVKENQGYFWNTRNLSCIVADAMGFKRSDFKLFSDKPAEKIAAKVKLLLLGGK